MDLVERYLQAVRFWLPRKGQDDLVAELSEDLRCQVEEAEAALGRPLDKAETAALLRKTGDPLQVAAQYLAQGPLLPPPQAMMFRLVVKIVLLWILLPLTVVTAVPSALLSTHPLASMAGALVSYGFSAITALGCITLVFTLVAGTWRGAAPASTWDPLKLPPLRRAGDAKPISRVGSTFQVVFGLLFAGWWMEASTRLPLAWSTLTGPVWSAGPLWADFHGRWFLPILVLTLANVAVAAANLARPDWDRLHNAWGAASGILVAAMCLVTFTAHRPALLENLHTLQTIHMNITDSASLGLFVDEMIGLLLLIVGLSSLGAALSQTVRLTRSKHAPN